MRARPKPVTPAATRVELADELEQPRGGRVEVRRELGDFIAQTVDPGICFLGGITA
jgi:hypothetical protein